MRSTTSMAGALLALAAALSACGGGETDEPSAAERALEELQNQYDELAGDRLDAPVKWASDDLENIGDWEYKVVDLAGIPVADWETSLNELGDERWEIVWIEAGVDGRVAILKRPAVSLLSKIPLSQLGRLLMGGGGEAGQ